MLTFASGCFTDSNKSDSHDLNKSAKSSSVKAESQDKGNESDTQSMTGLDDGLKEDKDGGDGRGGGERRFANNARERYANNVRER